LSRYLGTGFLAGEPARAFSVSHVLRSARPGHAAVGLFVSNVGGIDYWLAYPITDVRHHPREDVCQFQVTSLTPSDPPLTTFLRVRPSHELATFQYCLWGYPEDTYYELGSGTHRPDLIYTEGHVRRFLRDVPLPGIRGSMFLELSTVAGAGCSGSPVIARSSIGHDEWAVVGVYIGERINDRATSVSYAAPFEAVHDWLSDPT